jgi:hypothetical protein
VLLTLAQVSDVLATFAGAAAVAAGLRRAGLPGLSSAASAR